VHACVAPRRVCREEADLRGRKQSFYSQVTKCIEEYDAVMTEKKMHEDDLRQIQDYEEYFAQLEIEKAERAEKERIEAEKRAEEERAQKVLHDAAAKIQALFRGVQCRKEQAKNAGKKGKKGKVRLSASQLNVLQYSLHSVPAVYSRCCVAVPVWQLFRFMLHRLDYAISRCVCSADDDTSSAVLCAGKEKEVDGFLNLSHTFDTHARG
jgi:hypothetical protein